MFSFSKKKVVQKILDLEYDQLLEELTKNDIKGYKNNMFSCPIAQLIKLKTGSKDVWASLNNVGYHDGWLMRSIYFHSTDSIITFIKNFDEGRLDQFGAKNDRV